jgi:hypothetical protein
MGEIMVKILVELTSIESAEPSLFTISSSNASPQKQQHLLCHFCPFRKGQVIETFRGERIYQPAVDLAIEKLRAGAWVHVVFLPHSFVRLFMPTHRHALSKTAPHGYTDSLFWGRQSLSI